MDAGASAAEPPAAAAAALSSAASAAAPPAKQNAGELELEMPFVEKYRPVLVRKGTRRHCIQTNQLP